MFNQINIEYDRPISNETFAMDSLTLSKLSLAITKYRVTLVPGASKEDGEVPR